MIKAGDMPSVRTTVGPAGGWKAGGVYFVLVSYKATNPMHYAILHVGFLTPSGQPGSYSELFNHSYDGPMRFDSHFRLEVVHEAGVMKGDTLELSRA